MKIELSTDTISAQQQCEARLAEMAGRDRAMLASRATIALVALLRALRLPADSEVLLPAMLCANPAHAVRLAGLRPLFADISPQTLNMDLRTAECVLGPQTRAVLAVPLFGLPFDVSALLAFAERHELLVIEDAAHAVGLSYGGQPSGSVGVCSVYSFGPGKIADAVGGAALLSDDLVLLARARSELEAISPGRQDMDETASRILGALETLPAEIEGRMELAAQYRQRLAIPGMTYPRSDVSLPLWKYSVLLPTRSDRDNITRRLLQRGVAATNLYPPLPSFFPEARNSQREHYSVAHDLYNKIVNLPLWPQPPGLLENVVEAICNA